MAKFCSLFSSSSGNSTFIGTEDSGILIDVGVSAKKTAEALERIGSSPLAIDAIFITHEHIDHINGVRVFASKYNIPVYATRGTLEGMDEAGVFSSPVEAFVIPEKGIEANGMFVRPFRTSHDSNEPCGYTVVTPDGKRISIATDMGMVTEDAAENIRGSELVLLESNHDIGMLKMGSYPYFLKQRILSDTGHLNNDDSADFAGYLLENGTSKFVLGHLSKENNLPSLAYQTAKNVFDEMGAAESKYYTLWVSSDNIDPLIF